MTPERIGTIGSTHGVKDSSKPKPKKLAITSQKPLAKSVATFLSLTGVCVPNNCSAAFTCGGAAASDASMSFTLCSCGT